MIEYQVVTEAAIYPQVCLCGSSKGPFVDTMIEIQGRRQYICKLCVKRSARPFGFMAGNKMEELENASIVLEAKEKDLVAAHKRNEKQTQDNADLSTRLTETQLLVEHYKNLVETQKHIGALIFENAKGAGVNLERRLLMEFEIRATDIVDDEGNVAAIPFVVKDEHLEDAGQDVAGLAFVALMQFIREHQAVT